MREINLPSWEAFEEKVRKLLADHDRRRLDTKTYVSPLLFRGQSNSCWRLKTTIERYPSASKKASDYYRVMHDTQYQIENLTEQRWDIPTPADYDKWLSSQTTFGLWEFLGDAYMIYLRHHGFPSPLLDWSLSPYIAAFFAFSHVWSEVQFVSIYAFLEYADQGKSISPLEPTIYGRGPVVRSHRRHVLQQCQYTICTAQSDGQWSYACHEDAFAKSEEGQDLLWKFNIPSSERLKVLQLLDRFNLNAFSLFGSEESLMETLALREFLFRKGP
jgi:hypothetical protein